MKRNAFTMLELVFVIVVIGILASIAIPKLGATRDDAQIAKGRSDVAAIRSAIVSERQTRLIRGESSYISTLDKGVTNNAEDVSIFDDNDSNTTNGSLLMYGITTKNANGHWLKSADNTYIYKVINIPITFTYNSINGKFDCNTTDATYGNTCKMLVN
jgi:general secretion pathway protein G